jgi:hypothetical protein
MASFLLNFSTKMFLCIPYVLLACCMTPSHCPLQFCVVAPYCSLVKIDDVSEALATSFVTVSSSW